MRASTAFVAVFLTLSPAGAIAAPQRLDCNLITLETNTATLTNAMAENRSITVVIDQETNAITVYPNDSGSALVLANVTMSPVTIAGYISGQVSLSIDPSSWKITFQTYNSASPTAEFGTCSVSTKPLP